MDGGYTRRLSHSVTSLSSLIVYTPVYHSVYS